MNIKHPNFFVVGASKTGSSSLAEYLGQHPEIFVPKFKEPSYFIYHEIILKLNKKDKDLRYFGVELGKMPKTFDEYLNLYANVSNAKAIGDFSVSYLYYYDVAIKNIKKHLSIDPQIIIFLRDPVYKVYSQYKHLKRKGLEKKSFESAIKEENRRKKLNFGEKYLYLQPGFYFNQVKAYMDNFDKVKIFLYEDWNKNPKKILKEICLFLNVDSNFEFDTSLKINVTNQTVKNYKIHKFLNVGLIYNLRKYLKRKKFSVFNKMINKYKALNFEKPALNFQTKVMLQNEFKADILKLQELINRNLSQWLK